MNAQSLIIEDMCKIEGGGAFDIRWSLLKREGDIQKYEAHSTFGSEIGFIIDNVHLRLPEQELGIPLAFEDEEKICYECGSIRICEIIIDLKCNCTTWREWCYNPKHVKRCKNMVFPYIPEFEVQTEMLGPGPDELIRGGDFDGYAIQEYAKHRGFNFK